MTNIRWSSKPRRVKKKTNFQVDQIRALFALTPRKAALQFGMPLKEFKACYRRLDIKRWPNLTLNALEYLKNKVRDNDEFTERLDNMMSRVIMQPNEHCDFMPIHVEIVAAY
jgi:hypothetical protein